MRGGEEAVAACMQTNLALGAGHEETRTPAEELDFTSRRWALSGVSELRVHRDSRWKHRPVLPLGACLTARVMATLLCLLE